MSCYKVVFVFFIILVNIADIGFGLNQGKYNEMIINTNYLFKVFFRSRKMVQNSSQNIDKQYTKSSRKFSSC